MAVERVDEEIVVGDEEVTVLADGDIALEPANERVVDLGVVGVEAPELVAGLGIERVDIPVAGANDDPALVVEER